MVLFSYSYCSAPLMFCLLHRLHMEQGELINVQDLAR